MDAVTSQDCDRCRRSGWDCDGARPVCLSCKVDASYSLYVKATVPLRGTGSIPGLRSSRAPPQLLLHIPEQTGRAPLEIYQDEPRNTDFAESAIYAPVAPTQELSFRDVGVLDSGSNNMNPHGLESDTGPSSTVPEDYNTDTHHEQSSSSSVDSTMDSEGERSFVLGTSTENMYILSGQHRLPSLSSQLAGILLQ
jgi:hypothetical protein